MLGKILAASAGRTGQRGGTGTNIPENCTAGRMVMIAAAKIAAVWVAANTEIKQAETGARQDVDDPADGSASANCP